MNKKDIKVNYFFFLIWFILLTSFTIGHIKFLDSQKVLFVFHSLFLSLMEIMIFILLISIIERYLHKNLQRVFIGFLFIFLLLRFIDFIMINLMDSSISYALKMLFGNGIGNIATNLEAADINPLMIIGLVICLFITPIIGYFIYLLSKGLSDSKPTFISYKQAFSSILVLICLSFLSDLLSNFSLEEKKIENYKKRLPYSISLFSHKKSEITCEHICFSLKNEKFIDTAIASKDFTLPEKSNIFLFIIESLRKDYINYSTAPSLSKFRDENIHFKYSFSAANCTQPCWFSIFYSLYPVNWIAYKDNWMRGATSLKILKSMGYKINVFSSANLEYYNMEETIFGEKMILADSFTAYKQRAAWLRDKNAFGDLKASIDKKKENGNLFVVFLDSTHSEYNWPDDFKVKFSPVKKGINYIKFAYSHSDLSLLKNRYFNAINYLDSLFEDFFSYLKAGDIYDNSIVVITADHGEEFFERGSLFHGTHLNKYQTNIPTFYKFPGKSMKDIENKERITSLADIFPSIFQALNLETDAEPFFDGKSIFAREKNKRCICSAQNGANNSKQFAIYDEKSATILNHLQDNKFEVVSVANLDESEIENSLDR